jgi:hypothetical protein
MIAACHWLVRAAASLGFLSDYLLVPTRISKAEQDVKPYPTHLQSSDITMTSSFPPSPPTQTLLFKAFHDSVQELLSAGQSQNRNVTRLRQEYETITDLIFVCFTTVVGPKCISLD